MGVLIALGLIAQISAGSLETASEFQSRMLRTRRRLPTKQYYLKRPDHTQTLITVTENSGKGDSVDSISTICSNITEHSDGSETSSGSVSTSDDSLSNIFKVDSNHWSGGFPNPPATRPNTRTVDNNDGVSTIPAPKQWGGFYSQVPPQNAGTPTTEALRSSKVVTDGLVPRVCHIPKD